MTNGTQPTMLRVQVWFGSHVVAEYCAEPAEAQRYAAAIQRRFAGLRVTSQPVEGQPGEPIPAERWWSVLPR